MLFVLALIFVLIFVLPDLYISLVLMRGTTWWAHALLWLPTVVAIGLLLSIPVSGASNTKISLFTGLLLCIALPQLLFLICSLIGQFFSLFLPHSTLNIFNAIGICVGVLISIAMAYGVLFGWRTLTVRHVDLTFENLPPQFEGYRLVHLSDMHVGSYGTDPRFLERVVQRVNEEKADIILFTGDIINTAPQETAPFENVLSQLQAPDGVHSVLGNHDYCLYGVQRRFNNPREGSKEVIAAERRMGWDLLLNEHRLIRRDSASIAIVGVENTGKPPFPQIGDLAGARVGIPDDAFQILLSHDPSHWRIEVLPDTDIPLMLAGHTHAMQFRIGHWSPASWMYDEWGGLYQQGKQMLYVSEGVGGSLPFRLGATPEIIVLTLHAHTP